MQGKFGKGGQQCFTKRTHYSCLEETAQYAVVMKDMVAHTHSHSAFSIVKVGFILTA